MCQKWPTDERKRGRDYGEFLRAQLGRRFPHGELGKVDEAAEVERALGALERIANNTYYNENPLKRSSATGLSAESCSDAISNQSLAELKADETSLVARLKKSLSIKFSTLGTSQQEALVDPDAGQQETKENGKDDGTIGKG